MLALTPARRGLHFRVLLVAFVFPTVRVLQQLVKEFDSGKMTANGHSFVDRVGVLKLGCVIG